MSGNFTEIGVTLNGHVGVIEIQRPPANFFDHELIGQIADACEAFAQGDDCRAIVLCSQGRHFCAGANFGGADDDGDDGFGEDAFEHTARKLYHNAARLFAAKLPLVAAVQGSAIGGGLGLALAADFRVASLESRFSANFVKLGIHQGFGISATLPRLVGQQMANLMLLTGRRIGGEEALRVGLVDVLTDAASIRERALQLAAEIAANAPLAVVSVRETLREGLVDAIVAATERELAEQKWLRKTSDAAEGILAVAERREGKFCGR